MRVMPGELRLVANDAGKPRIFPIPIAPPPSPKAPLSPAPAPASFVAMRFPPCELAGPWAYCEAPGGTIYRTRLGTTESKAITKHRAGTRIDAVALGAEHAVVVALERHRTTEGEMLQAFATLDEGEPVRLSEDGAGATVVHLASRGEQAVAVYLDARSAMAPIHARTLAVKGSSLSLGPDAVLFVSGPPERGVELTVAGTPDALFALLPVPHETASFGVATIPIHDPPRHDVAAVWSMYPNGLDPAPIAGVVAPAGEGRSAYVARVRPETREPAAPRVLELGRLDAAGAFGSLGVIATGKRITDMALAVDAFGAVWVQYGDETATWLERRVCP